MDGVRDAGGFSVGPGFSGAAEIHEVTLLTAFAVAEHVLKPGWALRLRLADIVADVRGFTFGPFSWIARDRFWTGAPPRIRWLGPAFSRFTV